MLYLWTAGTSAFGLAFLPFIRMTGGEYQVVDGVLELHGGIVELFLRRFTAVGDHSAAAMTLGHVVIARDRFMLEATREHERVHVRQAERWGPLFLPAYGIASVIAILRGRDAYRGNAFEIEAYRVG